MRCGRRNENAACPEVGQAAFPHYGEVFYIRLVVSQRLRLPSRRDTEAHPAADQPARTEVRVVVAVKVACMVSLQDGGLRFTVGDRVVRVEGFR